MIPFLPFSKHNSPKTLLRFDGTRLSSTDAEIEGGKQETTTTTTTTTTDQFKQSYFKRLEAMRVFKEGRVSSLSAPETNRVSASSVPESAAAPVPETVSSSVPENAAAAVTETAAASLPETVAYSVPENATGVKLLEGKLPIHKTTVNSRSNGFQGTIAVAWLA